MVPGEVRIQCNTIHNLFKGGQSLTDRQTYS